MQHSPLVTIGMPIYNEERHIAAALDAVLKQDHEKLEIIISDNASTDGTADICKEYSRCDSRIRFVRNAENVGSWKNFLRLPQIANGEFFAYVGGHDLPQPAFVSRCVRELQQTPEAVLCFPRCVLINEAAQEVGPIHCTVDTRGLGKLAGFLSTLWGGYGYPLYGLARTKTLRRIHSSNRPMVGPDVVWLTELSLLGSIAFVGEPLLRMRATTEDCKCYFNKIYPNQRFNWVQRRLLLWQMIFEQMRCTNRHLLKRREKVVALTSVLMCGLTKYGPLLSKCIANMYRHDRLAAQTSKSSNS